MELPVSLIGWLLLGCAIVITALTAYGLRFGINYAQVNIKNSLFDALCKRAQIYVMALEQDPSLGGLASEEKKERAMLWLAKAADQMGVQISTAEASRVIEQSVFLMKTNVLPVIEEALEPEV